ncbi:LytR/AlgR family response regulator transcription factor [Tellurirhabdus rosea]|uniref:LytR/AlgR family response regulator transcription factor n=1 Tax=Tellurirhabdus rosea TaxID=2674997 RepID=UPI0022516DD5|nr:LytTR family DNA-binding domain-containing protein [Tellurirhabdus rosea]
MFPLSQRQHLFFRLVAVPLAALLAAHVVFERQFPWQPGYRFPLPWFLTVATVMLSCWQVNAWLFQRLDRRLPFHKNPVRRLGWQGLLGGSLTLLTFLVVFPNAIRLYTGRWPSPTLLATGLVVCATIATLINGIFIGLYLLKTIYFQQQETAGALNAQLTAHPPRPAADRILLETGNRTLLLRPEEIAYFYSSSGVVLLVKSDGQQITTHYKAFSGLADLLPETLFFQLNRQYIAGLHAIRSVDEEVNRKLTVHLAPALNRQHRTEPVAVSRYRSAELKKWLAQALPA